MPFSHSSLLSVVVGFLEQKQPQSILDVGVGFGQFGFLARINLEHVNLFEWDEVSSRKRDKKEWKIEIHGIEAFPEYITPVHDYAYNHIFIGDALEVLPRLDRQYDLVLAIEIPEHFDKEDGLKFIQMLKRASSGLVLISTPKEFIEQHYAANPYENHRSHWTRSDLEALGFDEFLDNNESWVACHKVKSG